MGREFFEPLLMPAADSGGNPQAGPDGNPADSCACCGGADTGAPPCTPCCSTGQAGVVKVTFTGVTLYMGGGNNADDEGSGIGVWKYKSGMINGDFCVPYTGPGGFGDIGDGCLWSNENCGSRLCYALNVDGSNFECQTWGITFWIVNDGAGDGTCLWVLSVDFPDFAPYCPTVSETVHPAIFSATGRVSINACGTLSLSGSNIFLAADVGSCNAGTGWVLGGGGSVSIVASTADDCPGPYTCQPWCPTACDGCCVNYVFTTDNDCHGAGVQYYFQLAGCELTTTVPDSTGYYGGESYALCSGGKWQLVIIDPCPDDSGSSSCSILFEAESDNEICPPLGSVWNANLGLSGCTPYDISEGIGTLACADEDI